MLPVVSIFPWMQTGLTLSLRKNRQNIILTEYTRAVAFKQCLPLQKLHKSAVFYTASDICGSLHEVRAQSRFLPNVTIGFWDMISPKATLDIMLHV